MDPPGSKSADNSAAEEDTEGGQQVVIPPDKESANNAAVGRDNREDQQVVDPPVNDSSNNGFFVEAEEPSGESLISL